MRASQLLSAVVAAISSGILANAFSINGTKPVTYGVVLFRAFDLLDLYGPLEVLQGVSNTNHIEVSLIAETLDTVLTRPQASMMNAFNSTIWPELPPTHSFASAPKVFDVLIIPGGAGIRSPYINSTLKYINDVSTRAQHIITICTGSALAARAGIMNGRNATTNKTSWPNVIPYGPNTTWIPHARWVEDYSYAPPIWSSSGVTAGLDLMFHFVQTYYSSKTAATIAKLMEYERHTDPTWDPFAVNETHVARF